MMDDYSEADIDLKCSYFLERIFLMSVDGETVNKARLLPRKTVFMLNFINETGTIKTSQLKSMLYERIRMTDLDDCLLLRCDVKLNEEPELDPINFLYNSYERLCCEKVEDCLVETCRISKKILVEFIGDNLQNPLMLNKVHKEKKFNVHESFYKLIINPSKLEKVVSLFYDLSSFFSHKQICTMINPLIQKLSNSIKVLDIDDFKFYQYCNFLISISKVEKIAFCIVTCKIKTTGLKNLICTQGLTTLLGTMLRKTCMFTGEQDQVDYYNKNQHLGPLQVDEDVHSYTKKLHNAVFEIFKNILKFARPKLELLTWIGNLIKNFEFVAQLYHHEF